MAFSNHWRRKFCQNLMNLSNLTCLNEALNELIQGEKLEFKVICYKLIISEVFFEQNSLSYMSKWGSERTNPKRKTRIQGYVLQVDHLWSFFEQNSLSYMSNWGSERTKPRKTTRIQGHLLQVDHLWSFFEQNFLSYMSNWGSERTKPRKTTRIQSNLLQVNHLWRFLWTKFLIIHV